MGKQIAFSIGSLCKLGLVWLTAYISIRAALSLKNIQIEQQNVNFPRKRNWI